MPKFFTKPDSIFQNNIKITGEDVSHISKVLRMSKGDSIIVCDGSGNDYDAQITSISKTEVTAEIIRKYQCTAEPELKITLFQALPKQGKMEYIIQKNVELGITEFVPVYTKRCIAKPTNKTERWQKIAESAAKQSGRGIIPKVFPTVSFEQAIDLMSKSDLAIMPYECEEKVHLKSLLTSKNAKSISIFIGPEGGFDISEIKYATDNGIKTVTLGKRILRTETASLAVLPIILYEFGEM